MQFHLRGYHPLWQAVPDPSIIALIPSLSRMISPAASGPPRAADAAIHDLWSCNPRLSFRITWFRLFRVRSPLLSESRLFSLPRGTEMVHFPPFASYRYSIHDRIPGVHTRWIPPFGNPRITDCLHLPEAYRRWPRPSSPSSAKAFPRMPLVA